MRRLTPFSRARYKHLHGRPLYRSGRGALVLLSNLERRSTADLLDIIRIVDDDCVNTPKEQFDNARARGAKVAHIKHGHCRRTVEVLSSDKTAITNTAFSNNSVFENKGFEYSPPKKSSSPLFPRTNFVELTSVICRLPRTTGTAACPLLGSGCFFPVVIPFPP